MSYNWTVDTPESAAEVVGTLLRAKKANHRLGLPWTHPATGETYLPPAKAKRLKLSKRAKKAVKGGKRARR